ncbi:IclR family transcriptional regulator [Microbacterium sp. Marseille-Q6965]|uniref:IclR family transcriptional regulator n=1 Tax=Microbacterium sp. Marseille-Q6965 TaxID=2965072 RepID=UPI0021B70FB6|nr:IclR family transcriptional regulator [Microbacterium sp. Marseille-Q6965]
MTMTSGADSALGRRSSIERAHRLLSAFDYAHTRLTLSELSRRTGTPLTSTHRLVSDMLQLGMLERDDEGCLTIGVDMWRFGLLAPRTYGIQRVALPFMQDVYATTGMPVHLGVREGNDATFVESLRPRTDVDERPRLGSSYLLHTTAVGTAILASMPPAFQEDYLEMAGAQGEGEEYRVDAGVLRRELALVRSEGYAVSRRKSAPSVSLGAPVLDTSGNPLGAVSIIVPDGSVEASYGHLIRSTARAVQRTAWEQGLG